MSALFANRPSSLLPPPYFVSEELSSEMEKYMTTCFTANEKEFADTSITEQDTTATDVKAELDALIKELSKITIPTLSREANIRLSRRHHIYCTKKLQRRDERYYARKPLPIVQENAVLFADDNTWRYNDMYTPISKFSNVSNGIPPIVTEMKRRNKERRIAGTRFKSAKSGWHSCIKKSKKAIERTSRKSTYILQKLCTATSARAYKLRDEYRQFQFPYKLVVSFVKCK